MLHRIVSQGKIFVIAFAMVFESSVLLAEDVHSPSERPGEVLPHMQLAYQALMKVLGYTSRSNEHVKLSDLTDTEDQLRQLSEQAKIIHQLMVREEKGKEFRAADLEKSTQLAYSRFKSGHQDQVKFHISEAVNDCFECHTSRGSAADSRFTSSFAKDLQALDLDPLTKARFLSLSRQFDASAEAYERILLAKDFDLDGYINFDPLMDYLILTLRVKSDAPRALKTLGQLENRDLPTVIKREISSWAKALRAYNSRALKGNPAQKAEALIRTGRSTMEFPRDRTAVVEFILASKYLRDYLNQERVPPMDKAKAYYDLGACETVVGTSFASDEANVYFAEAIRLAPKTDLAKKAYARYEENIYLSFSGSSGVKIPDDEKDNMIKLKSIAF
jgi:hypothetical protein